MIKKFGTWVGKLYRKDAPETSVQAAHQTNTATLEELVYNILVEAGSKGMISDEVRDVCQKRYNITSYSSVTARYKSLYDKGLIAYTGEKRKGKSGKQQRVMHAIFEL